MRERAWYRDLGHKIRRGEWGIVRLGLASWAHWEVLLVALNQHGFGACIAAQYEIKELRTL